MEEVEKSKDGEIQGKEIYIRKVRKEKKMKRVGSGGGGEI